MRSSIIISGTLAILASFIAMQTGYAQDIPTEKKVERAEEVEKFEKAKDSKAVSKEKKEEIKKDLKAEKPKFKGSSKDSGNEADFNNAFEERSSVVVEWFDTDKTVSDKMAENIREYVVTAIEKRGRLDIINPDDILVDGKRFKKTEAYDEKKFKDNDRFKALAEQGVRYVIAGEVTDYDDNEYHNAQGKSFFESTVTVRFTAYDLVERAVLRTRYEKAAVHGLASKSKADDKLVAGFKDNYNDFLNKDFKIRTTLKEVNGVTKKGVVKSCLINAGDDLGVTVNDNFDVYILSTGGDDLKKLGRVKATKNIYSNFSECNVTAGAEKITDAMDAGAELIFLSDDNTIIF